MHLPVVGGHLIELQVMESTNRGMEVLWATRLTDGKECVVKTRQKALKAFIALLYWPIATRKLADSVAPGQGISFKSATEERNWRSTTEVQMSMPQLGMDSSKADMASPGLAFVGHVGCPFAQWQFQED